MQAPGVEEVASHVQGCVNMISPDPKDTVERRPSKGIQLLLMSSQSLKQELTQRITRTWMGGLHSTGSDSTSDNRKYKLQERSLAQKAL